MSFDLMTCVIISLFLFISFLRGFVREIVGLLGCIGSVYVTYRFNGCVADLLSQFITSTLIARIVSVFAVYVVAIVVFSCIKKGILKFCENTGLGFADKFLGLFVGFIKGASLSLAMYLLVIIIYPITSSVEYDVETQEERLVPEWLTEARLYPVFELFKNELEKMLPEGLILRLERRLETRLEGRLAESRNVNRKKNNLKDKGGSLKWGKKKLSDSNALL